MSCILRISGDNLDIDSLLSAVDMRPDRCWRRGEPRWKSKPERASHEFSGVTFVASDADFSEFDLQVTEVSRFLEDYAEAISVMVNYEGVEGAQLDFGIEFRDVAIHGDFLPNAFLRLAATSGVDVLLSHYPSATENEESEQVAPSNR